MTNIDNVVALDATPTALRCPTSASPATPPIVRMTAAFRAMLDAPTSPVELALLRLILGDVTDGNLTGSVTWSLDAVIRQIVIRQWPTGRILDLMPFPVERLDPATRALRFVAHTSLGIATIGIAGDADPALRDADGRAIGSPIGVFP